MFTNEAVAFWGSTEQNTVHGSVLPAEEIVWRGTLAMNVNGQVFAMDKVANALLFTTIPGADANGGVTLWSRQQNIFYTQLGGVSKTLSVSVTYPGPSIIVQLGTDGGGLVTSTAAQVVQAILAHAVASQLLHPAFTNTGAGLAAAATATPVTQYTLLGIAEETYDNSTGAANLIQEMRFKQGIVRLAGLATDPVTYAMVGGQVALVDNVTVQGSLSSNSYNLKLVDVETSGAIFVDLAS